MKNKIIIAGDSYAFGHGLSDRVHYFDYKSKTWIGDADAIRSPSYHCWPSLASRDFTNFEFLNISLPGNSNDNMFLQLVDSIDYDTTLVIFAGSMIDRTIIRNFTDDEHIVPWIVRVEPPEWTSQPNAYTTAKENFIKHLYSSKIGKARSSTAILAAWALALTHQSMFAWSVPRLETELINSKELSNSHIKGMNFPSIVNYQFDEKFGLRDYHVADGHINEVGHLLYYENEIKPLLTRLLS